MDLFKIDVKSVNSMLVGSAILGIIGLCWKKRDFLDSKIKSVALFLYLPEIKGYFSDICQRALQTQKPTNSQPSLQDYIQSFGSWKSQSGGTAIPALCINVSGEIETYNNVTSVRAYQIDPFTPLYGLGIEMEEPGYTLYGEDILGISYNEIYRLARMFYFRAIVENYNNQNPIDS